ncbi:MAG: NAD(P)H-binding protein [Bacteroidota bacterium]|nr:NAD(P)H-binding protein [Bacteroidota bacterium]
MNKTAIVIGATGLVGSSLLEQLLEDDHFDEVKVFHRRTTGLKNPKLKEYIVDFENPAAWKGKITGDVLFSAMGTTIKKAGSKKAQYGIDYTYQYNTAKAASENGVQNYVLVSSAGANQRSKIFYSRMKGELDEAVQKLPFRNIVIMRPSILAGNRNEKRSGEQIGLVLAKVFTRIPGLRKYRPIHGKEVAAAMIRAFEIKQEEKIRIFTLDEIFSLLAPGV